MSEPLTPLKVAVEMHKQDMRLRRLSDRTQEQYDYMLSKLLDFLRNEDVVHVEEITSAHLRAFLLNLEEKGLSPATVNTAAKCAKAWLNFLVKEEVLAASPMRTVPMPKLKRPRPVIFTPEEVSALLEATNTPRDRAMLLFLLDSGVRRAELVALDVGDVDLQRGIIHVRSGKGGKDRVTFLSDESLRALQKYLRERVNIAPDSPLWLTFTTHKRLTAQGARMVFRRLSERTGIEHATPHTFRRTCATWCLQRGMNVYQTAAILGHSDITTLKHYLRFTEQNLYEAHQANSPVQGLFEEKKV